MRFTKNVPSSIFLLALGFGVVAPWAQDPANAQVRIQVGPGGQRVKGDGAGEEAEDVGGRFRTDRTSNQRLSKAQDLIAEQRWAEAIGFLISILEQAEDFWFQPERTNKSMHRSVKHVALELIGKLPKDARETYELQSGADARRLLDEAVASGDRKQLEEVCRRYFHTAAGYEATHRLAMHDLDHGHPLPAALLLEKLRAMPSVADKLEPMLSLKVAVAWDRAGLPEKAAEVLTRLKQRSPDAKVMLAGKDVKMFDDPKGALPWLRNLIGPQDTLDQPGAEEVALFRGNPARNAQSIGGAPLLNARWRIPTANEKSDVEKIVRQQIQDSLDRSQTALPSLHPLAVRLDLHEASQLRPGQVRNWQRLVSVLSAASGGKDPVMVGKLPGAGPLVHMATLLTPDLRNELIAVSAKLPALRGALDAQAEGRAVDNESAPWLARYEGLKVRVIDELNAALTRRDFYDERAWQLGTPTQQDALRTEAAEWLKRGVANLADDELYRLNRTLFDAALRIEPSYGDEMVSRSYADVVLMRTYNNLLAVDFVTGKRVWEIPKPEDDDLLDRLAKGPGNNTRANPADLGYGLKQRLFEDATFGTLASDGRNVYSIEDLNIRTMAQMQQIRVIAFNGGVQESQQHEHNRLTAHDIRTGKLVWEVGGPKSEELELAGTFFLGAPLPLDGLLYVLGESKGEIRLMVLNPKNGGKLEWSQTLFDVDQATLQGGLRALAGASPSYSDGVLVCPTAAGAVVAVDLTSRSLLWGYRYKSTQMFAGNNAMAMRVMMANGQISNQQQSSERWIDSLATIADGKAILTPGDSDEIHCINLVDGSVAWKRPRNNGLFIGGIFDNKVLVVGKRQVQALNLVDSAAGKAGEPAWKTDNGMTTIAAPSGRGFLSGSLYYLPVHAGENTGEVISIDVNNGRIVSRTRSRSEYVPGNLVCFRGAVVSQGVLAVESFHELAGLEKEIANDLARNPDDPVALGKRGEVLAQRGQIKAAIQHLKRSLELKDDAQNRQLLVDALLEGLRVDFANNRGTAKEIEDLVAKLPEGSASAVESKARFLRLMAVGLQGAGEREAAFAMYMNFVTPELDDAPLERIEGSWQVQRHRWVQGQLNDLWNEANGEQRGKMDAHIQTRLAEARDKKDPQAMRRFLAYFGNHPFAQQARVELSDMLVGRREWLEAELLLRRLEADPTPEISRGAKARLAALLEAAKRPQDSARIYAELAGPLADVVCLNGQTGAQIVAALAPNHPVKNLLKYVSPWPVGKVEAQTSTAATGQRHQYQYPVRMMGDVGPFFRDRSLVLDQSQQFLACRDELGVEMWKINLQTSGRRGQIFNPVANHARAHGHLLLIARGQYVHAVDTLGTDDKGTPRVLWEESLTEGAAGNNAVNFNRFNVGGKWQIVATDAYGQPIGPVGPVNGQHVVFQRQRKLIAVDPLSGKEAWIRNDVDPGSDIFGDEELLFVVPPDKTEAVVLRAVDGKRIDRRAVPPANQRLASLGRKVLCWSDEAGKHSLKLVDVWQQKELWKKQFAIGAKTALIDLDEVGVVDLDGNVSLVEIASGKALLQQKIQPEANMNELYLMRSPDRYILITSKPYQQNNNNLFVSAVNGGVDNPIINGHVHLFDRNTGKLVRSTPVERQAMTLNQPSGLPVLAFACRVYDRLGKRNRDPYELLCVDKRNGEIVYNEKLSLQLNGMDLEGKGEDREVKIKLIQGGITFKFTDQPYDKKVEEKKPDEPAAGQPKAGANPANPAPGGAVPQNAAPNVRPGLQLQPAAPKAEAKPAEKAPEAKAEKAPETSSRVRGRGERLAKANAKDTNKDNAEQGAVVEVEIADVAIEAVELIPLPAIPAPAPR